MSKHRKANQENRKIFHSKKGDDILYKIDTTQFMIDTPPSKLLNNKNENIKSFIPPTTYLNPEIRYTSGEAIHQKTSDGDDEDDIYFLETENPHTIFLLLDSPEPNVVSKVLQYFNKKSEDSESYAKKLHEMKIVEKILKKNFLKTLNKEDQLHCLNIIQKICETNQDYDPNKTLTQNIQNGNEIEPKFDYDTINELYDITKDYIQKNNEYAFVDQSAAISTNLLDESRIKLEYEKDNNYLLKTFVLIKLSEDDSVLYHCLSMVNKILPGLTNFEPFYNFPFSSTVQLINKTESEKLQEMALTVLAGIITTINDEQLLNQLVNSSFLYDIIKILENTEKSNCHPQLLAALKSLMKIEKIAKNFFGDVLLKRLFDYANTNKKNFIATVNVLCELSAFPQAFENLFLFGFIDLLFQALKENLKECGSDICLAISRMYKYPNAYTVIIEKNPILELLKILSDETRNWDVREKAADTIYNLISRSFILADYLVKNYFESVFTNLLNRPFGVVTPECILKLIDILNILHKYEDLRDFIMNLNLSNCLLQTIQESFRSADILSSLLNCLSIYIYQKTLQDVLLSNEKYCDILFRCLRSPATIVKSAVTILIMLSGKMKPFSNLYIEKGILERLITDQQSLSTCETWSPAIETILNTNPSIKFCVHGRLDFIDKISPDFYISKRPLASYRVLCQIIADEVSPLYPILLVNYDHVVCPAATIVQIKSANPNTKPSDNAGGTLKNKTSSKALGNATCDGDWTYCRRPSDCNLPRYLEMVKCALESLGLSENYESKDFIDIRKIDERAKVIAEVVFNEMCGDRPGKQTEICSESAVTNHLNQMKCRLHCNIIPLGQIRFGGHFERALLFKSLCDQIGLPCTLKRNVDQKILYCEIPVPLPRSKFPSLKEIPIEHLVPTHIIDLMDAPGELYPINSPEAFKYLNLV